MAPRNNQNEVLVPHYALPLSFTGINGGARVNEQDTDEDVIDCVKAICAFPIGSRDDEPTFGIPDMLFQQRSQSSANVPALKTAIMRWEPRIAVKVSEDSSGYDELLETLVVKIGGSDG